MNTPSPIACLRHLVVIAAISNVLLGCATVEVPAKLYDMKEGTQLTASFMWRGDTKGPISIQRAPEICNGEYRTISGGQISTAMGWGKLFGTMYSATSIDRSQRGVAIAICPSGVTFDCEYIANVRTTAVDGHGVCKDNRSATYRLLF